MVEFRNIKGTHDLLPDDLRIWQKVQSKIYYIMQQYGYKEIRTPAFENTELFIQGIGTDTDIVNKEMYSWVDQGGNALTLKPELTAPIVRAYLQHQMWHQNPLHRLYYFDTLFRRERPQKGRQRQFYQFGAEAIGVARVLGFAYLGYIAGLIMTYKNGPDGHGIFFISLLVAQIGTFLNLWHQYLFVGITTTLDDAIIVSVLTALLLVGYIRIRSRL